MNENIQKMFFWQLINNYKIEIPIIQRDYVQGRKNEERIAKNLIDNIYDALNNNKEMSLDFIYGRTNSDTFIPIDGQQRLTTLWLLYWYIATKESRISEVKNVLLKFSYETRLTSQDFCKNLVEKGLENSGYNGKISEQIRNQNWYRLIWEKDPTVVNMLNMLDIIEEKFKETRDLYDKLYNNCPVKFYFLPLEQFSLNDELYVKMNARGKPLSEFEYFKAKFSQLLDSKNKHKIDNEWLHIFWKVYLNKRQDTNNKSEQSNLEENLEKIEKQFYNFFENLALLFYTESNEIDKGFMDNYNLINFYDAQLKIQNYGIFNSANVKRIAKYLNYFENLENINDIEKKYFEDFYKSHKEINYWERVRFYSLLVCLDENINDQQIKENWLRIAKNLINNTRIEEPKDFYNAIKSLKSMSEHISELYNKLADNRINIEFFSREQIEEEKYKCCLILKDREWENLIKESEKFPYFDGQIGFILKMAEENGNPEKNKFKKYFEILKNIFTNYKEHKEFIFERALLSKGDYLVKKYSNKTFCNYEERLRAKMDNWRKVFNDDNKREFLKSLLNNIRDIDTIKVDLISVINNFLENIVEKDWRYFFIKNFENLKYCGKRMIRFEDSQNKNFPLIYLLSKEKLSSRHAELYTYNLYTSYLKDLQKEGLEYIFSNSYDMPYILIKKDGSTKIKYDASKAKIIIDDNNKQYEFDILEGEKVKEKVSSILEGKIDV